MYVQLHDNKIKLWFKGRVLVLIHYALNIKEIILVLMKSIGNFWKLKRWSEEKLRKIQSSDQIKHASSLEEWREQDLMDTCSEGSKLWRVQSKYVMVLFVFLWQLDETNKEI